MPVFEKLPLALAVQPVVLYDAVPPFGSAFVSVATDVLVPAVATPVGSTPASISPTLGALAVIVGGRSEAAPTVTCSVTLATVLSPWSSITVAVAVSTKSVDPDAGVAVSEAKFHSCTSTLVLPAAALKLLPCESDSLVPTGMPVMISDFSSLWSPGPLLTSTDRAPSGTARPGIP